MSEPPTAPSPTTAPSPKRRQAAPKPCCAICGQPAHSPVVLGAVRPSLAQALMTEHPNLTPDDVICRKHLTEARSRYVQQLLEHERGELSDLEQQVVESLAHEEFVAENVEEAWEDQRTFGEKVADIVADFGGSWNFIIIFFIVLAIWMAFNIVAASEIFDPYPFILLNLVLSCIAAIQAPIIMMSQNRQEDKDRLRSQNDFKVNLKAELEIRHLHEKIDHLINRQWERLAEIQQIQLEIMEDLAARKR